MLKSSYYLITGLIFVISFALQTKAVTVNPLCPTNKIAPHKRVARYDNSNPRTFGEFYNLLKPDNLYDAPSGLQEKPQEDDPADCGEIEDYDENDLSSVTPHSLRRQGHKSYRLHSSQHLFNQQLFGFNHGVNRPMIPSQRPTRPPAGGYFGNNPYRQPKPLEPTDYVKPVHEDGHEPHVTYRPGLVGAPIGHVVGLPQVKPTRHYSESTTHKKSNIVNHSHIRTSTQSYMNTYKSHRPRNADGGIIRSFIDLLL
ncbi:uncharacterized protein LOC135193548 [Vanessa tameamea]|uniref:Uncharacterized protein LOC135193548 n=1 Tax=Vanessa tameamea TaxID=334116 RepID=A0ABM4AMN2_VANTA